MVSPKGARDDVTCPSDTDKTGASSPFRVNPRYGLGYQLPWHRCSGGKSTFLRFVPNDPQPGVPSALRARTLGRDLACLWGNRASSEALSARTDSRRCTPTHDSARLRLETFLALAALIGTILRQVHFSVAPLRDHHDEGPARMNPGEANRGSNGSERFVANGRETTEAVRQLNKTKTKGGFIRVQA